MTTYIAMLRGINVGGKNRIPMVELKAMCLKIGLKNCVTYIQSGNMIFQSPENNSVKLEENVKLEIQKRFKLDVPVIVRTMKEMEKVAISSPFISQIGIDPEKLYVTFLEKIPQPEQLEKIVKFTYPPDEFIIQGKEIYLHCPVSYGNSKLTNSFFESKLKVTTTTRNWRTVNELIRLAGEQ
jgi:uncharacterized protein (DUF1697 family)